MSDLEKHSYYQFTAGERINGRFWAHSQIGKGSYATVIRAYNYKETVDVALKFLKNGKIFNNVGVNEVKTLDLFHKYNEDRRYAIIMYITSFMWRGHFCIVFPLYNYNLYYSIKKAAATGGFSLDVVRKIAKQLLECVHFLQHPNICFIHTDIKPDNILFVNARSNRIKLIDFGSSIRNPPVNKPHILQTVYYRSPEMIMDLPFDYAIDMWSVACVLMELRTGHIVFEEKSDTMILNSIIEVCGLPPLEMIENSRYSDIWFDLKPEKIALKKSLRSQHFPPGSRSLRSFLHRFLGRKNDLSINQEELFYDLIKHTLVYNQKDRLKPLEALRHPFIASEEDYSYRTDQIEIPVPEEIGNFAKPHTVSESNLNFDMSELNLHIGNELSGDLKHSQAVKKSHSTKNLDAPSHQSSGFVDGHLKLQPILEPE